MVVCSSKRMFRDHFDTFWCIFAPKALFVWLPNTHEVSEKRCPLYNALYAVLGSGRGMCRQIRYHRKFLGYVSTWKGNQKFFYERQGTGGGSTRSISARRNSKMDDFATIWKSLMRPLYSPEIDQGCTMRVTLAGFSAVECRRMIRAVQTRNPDCVNREQENSLYDFQLWVEFG